MDRKHYIMVFFAVAILFSTTGCLGIREKNLAEAEAIVIQAEAQATAIVAEQDRLDRELTFDIAHQPVDDSLRVFEAWVSVISIVILVVGALLFGAMIFLISEKIRKSKELDVVAKTVNNNYLTISAPKVEQIPQSFRKKVVRKEEDDYLYIYGE